MVRFGATVRVLIDYRPALRNRTGVGEFVHHLVTALVNPHAEGGPGDDPIQLTAFSSSWRHRLIDAPPPKLPASVNTIDRRIPVRLLNLAWHRAGWPTVELLTGNNYEVVHSPHPLLMPSRSAARVITIHDLDFLDHPYRATGEIRRDYPALVRRHAQCADHIVVPSRYTAKEVERRLDIPSEVISVCRNGAPSWEARHHVPRPGHLLFVGTLLPRKNLDGLLAAYEHILTTHPNIPDLVLAGSKVNDELHRHLLGRRLLDGRVHCTGYVNGDKLKTLYAEARLLVLPSFDEGFGLPVLEAMTVGVPVVAANRGALPEVLGDAGLLVDPRSTDELVTAIMRVLSDDSFAAACATRGIARARMFSWDTSAQTLLAAYRQAVKTRDKMMRRSV